MALILGLDIDPHTVRGAVLKTALRSSQVVAYLAASIEPAATEEERDERLREAVRSVLAAVGQPTDKVITELSGDEVSVRAATLPVRALKKLDQLLPFELEGKVPFDVSESIVDHQPVETIAGEMKMLAAVVPKERVASHLAQMKLLGIDPREVAIGAVALDGLVALLPELQTPGPHCIIDMHPEGTDVCIIRDGKCHFARTISITIADIDAGHQARLSRELKQTLASWRMEGGPSPSAFYVGGAMATREGTDTWLTQIVGAEVKAIELPEARGVDPSMRPSFARAVALAGRALTRGRHLNARRGEFATKQTATVLRKQMPLMAACATMIVAAFVFSAYSRYSVLDARHQQLEDELGRVTDDYFGARATSPRQARRMLERGARGVDPMPQFDAYDALTEISASIPEEVIHDTRQLQIDLGDGEETGRFSLRGTVDSVSDTESILRTLRAHRVVRTEGDSEVRLMCFRNVELGNSSATADERWSYRLSGQIRCLPEGQDPDEERGRSNRRRNRRGS